jgi:hypothetical protein
MRVRNEKDGLTAMAVAGTYVVLLGWDMAEQTMLTQGVLGFAVRRLRERDGERIWLSGMKTFQQVDPFPVPGEPVTTFLHPLQTFQWADYSASPDERYVYTVVAMEGQPGALVPGPQVELAVKTERVDQGKHAVFFNRGAVASQEYARRFQNRPPDEVGTAAFNWLSRGLVEAGVVHRAGRSRRRADRRLLRVQEPAHLHRAESREGARCHGGGAVRRRQRG